MANKALLDALDPQVYRDVHAAACEHFVPLYDLIRQHVPDDAKAIMTSLLVVLGTFGDESQYAINFLKRMWDQVKKDEADGVDKPDGEEEAVPKPGSPKPKRSGEADADELQSLSSAESLFVDASEGAGAPQDTQRPTSEADDEEAESEDEREEVESEYTPESESDGLSSLSDEEMADADDGLNSGPAAHPLLQNIDNGHLAEKLAAAVTNTAEPDQDIMTKAERRCLQISDKAFGLHDTMEEEPVFDPTTYPMPVTEGMSTGMANTTPTPAATGNHKRASSVSTSDSRKRARHDE